MKLHVEMKNAMLLHFSEFSVEDQKQMNLVITHKLIDKNGRFFSIMNHYQPLFFDDNDKVWMMLVVSNLSTRNQLLHQTYIESRKTNERFMYSQHKKKVILAHKITLTVKESEVLALSSQGYSAKEIAIFQQVSVDTIKYHKKNILSKFNVQNISEAISYAYSHNLIYK